MRGSKYGLIQEVLIIKINKIKILKVVIESLNNQIVSDYCFKGWLGAANAGHDVKLLSLSAASLQQDKLKEERPMPIGSVEYMEYFFDLYGIEKPLPLHCTSNLMQNKYQVYESKYDITYPAFIKPNLDVKKFTGFVAKSVKDLDLYPELGDWDGPYFVRKPFISPIISEWMVFVHKGRIINCSYYNGSNPRRFPDPWSIGYLVERYINPPVAYTIDVAVLDSGETVLVEFNDMWAIGPYGCNEDDYFGMLKDRWNEISGNRI